MYNIGTTSCRLIVSRLCLTALALSSCTTVNTDGISKFDQGLLLTHTQTDTIFAAANALAQEESIKYVIASNKVTITDADFTPLLSPDAVAEWDTSFSKLEAYASALQTLSSGNEGTQFSNSAQGLGKQLQTGAIGAKISNGVAAAFIELGQALINLKAGHDAQAIMHQTDPAIRQVFTQMAAAIGENNKSGLRADVWSNWTTKIAQGPGQDYIAAGKNGNNTAQKTTAAQSYVAMMAQRDAQLSTLATLRQSLLALADAHTAAAKGASADLTGTISLINTQLDQTQTILSNLNATAKATSSSQSSTGSR